MEKKQEKSQAELYREERKKRMAKAAQKNSKKSPQLAKIGKIIGKCLGIIIVIAVVLVAVYGILSFFGVPQRAMTAMKVGDKKVSVAKYKYYYMSVYTSTLSTALNYESQGAGYGQMYTGFDYTLLPEKQNYIGTIDGIENPTWADYFDKQARESIQQFDLLAEEARLNNITLNDDEKKEIDDQIADLQENADSNDYSLSRFIVVNYGSGVTEKIIREAAENQKLAQKYYQQKQQELMDSINPERINKEFEENKANYTTVGIASFTVAAETPEIAEDASDEEVTAANEKAMADAKAKAEGYLAQITDDNSVVKIGMEYDKSLTSESIVDKEAAGSKITSISEEAENWVYSADRQPGDKAVFEGTNGYTIIYIISLPTRDETKLVDVRHILIKYSTEDSDTEPTDEQKAAAKEKAESIYEEYKKNPTIENFETLAKENSEDTGSASNGGLIEDIYPGKTVEGFNDWVFDAARKPGDTDVIESSYGYHVIYYVGNDNPAYWSYQCQSTLASDDMENYNTDLLNKAPINPNVTMINWAQDQLESVLSNIIYRITQQTSSAS